MGVETVAVAGCGVDSGGWILILGSWHTFPCHSVGRRKIPQMVRKNTKQTWPLRHAWLGLGTRVIRGWCSVLLRPDATVQALLRKDVINLKWTLGVYHWRCPDLTWSVSPHTVTRKITRATLKCCYALHSYVGTTFGCDKLLAEQHPPSRNGGKASEDSLLLLVLDSHSNRYRSCDNWRCHGIISSHCMGWYLIYVVLSIATATLNF